MTGYQPSKDKKELHTFLGVAPYMSSFIPKLADHTAPIGDLLKVTLTLRGIHHTFKLLNGLLQK